MMRYLGFLILFFFFTGEVFSNSLRDKNEKTVSVTRILRIPHLKSISGSRACDIKFTDPHFGYLKDSTYFLEKLLINFTCYAADDGIVGSGAVRFDSERNEWVRDIEKRITANYGTWSTSEIMKMRRDFARAIQVYPLKTTDASGYAYTEDDTTGDAQWHRRTLNFCLIKPPKALCGGNFNGYYVDNKETDLTPYFLQILRSIEFIDDMPPAHSSDDSHDLE